MCTVPLARGTIASPRVLETGFTQSDRDMHHSAMAKQLNNVCAEYVWMPYVQIDNISFRQYSMQIDTSDIYQSILLQGSEPKIH